MWLKPEKYIEEEFSVGDGIKLKNSHRESFWVTFQGERDGKMFGKVDNHLIQTPEYNYGDIVSFEKTDIWNVNTDIKRKKQMEPILRFIYKFQEVYGRKPQIQELDMLLTI